MIIHKIAKALDFGNTSQVIVDGIAEIVLHKGFVRVVFYGDATDPEQSDKHAVLEMRCDLQTWLEVIDHLADARDVLLQARRQIRPSMVVNGTFQ
jgi:hypothetical protein